MNLLKLFDLKKTIIWLILFIVFTVIQVYILWNLPGYKDLACVEKGYFTHFNVLYSIITSGLFGLLIVGIAILGVRRSATSTSLGLISGLFVTLTTFCTACTIPVIGLFGFSIGLTVFTFYNFWFKALSLVLIILGIFIVDQKIIKGCKLDNRIK